LSDGLEWFNSLAEQEAQELLYGCLALRTWASNVVAGRPYESVSHLMARA